MGLEPRQSLVLWEELFDEFQGAPLTPRRARIAQRTRTLDNAIALIRLVAQTGVSDEAFKHFTRFVDAERKRDQRTAAKANSAA